ncbi:MAG: hypothetical protein DYG98_23420 [Haliscomenobacteraceae bacterium CHB4]|nr:hypothetical protein [Saprospiraceae bacterium]MCE7926010.1 hypothetical protein [Haliscomenobacteraceae bacterium CHB4]
MTRLQFDQNGYLRPYGAIPATVQVLEELFVKAFPFSDRRRWLFENYLDFISVMQRDVFPYFVQWVNGSFVTQKQEPKDIDTLTFLDYRVYKAKSDAMERFWSFNLENKGLDNYFVAVYPPEHELHALTLENQTRWQKLYSNTRPQKDGMILPKGFLELTFEKEI